MAETENLPALGASTLDAWAGLDAQRAVVDADRKLGPLLDAARACVLDNLDGSDRDRYSACATLGRIIASRGGSASFASTEIDALVRAVPGLPSAFLLGARASLMEGYSRALAERSQAEREATWAPPACVVLLGEARAAVAAGFPSEDPYALAGWADRVAAWLTRARVKRVAISGGAAAKAALADALELVGISIEPPREIA